MKIDVTQPILDLDGQQIDGDATLRKAALQALLNPLRGDEGQAGGDKAKCFDLAMKINSQDAPDLSVEEWTIVKERCGRAYPALVVGRVYEMIEAPKLRAVGASE